MHRKVIFLVHFFLLCVLLVINNVHAQSLIHKKVLDNGLTVLVRPAHHIPLVNVHLFYHVGSKDEKSQERGKAHMLEHMVFKGTNMLSESDIPLIGRKLAAQSNAYTSHDVTSYFFQLPTCHWEYALCLLANCMNHCTFKDDLINSEMKAVIQELKMYKDNYARALIESLMSTIFEAHPYQYPIIGYKQDLWNIQSVSLHEFYQKHYIPNNAVLVVVGDVVPENVFDQAQKYFGHIPKDESYTKVKHYINRDIAAKSVTMYRDVVRPLVQLAFLVPGSSEKQDHILKMLNMILGQGKSSRLYKKIVDQQRLATTIYSDIFHMFDHALLFICFEPLEIKNIEKIIEIIQQEIGQLASQGVSPNEMQKIKTSIAKEYADLFESPRRQADLLGKYFLATGDEYFIFNCLSISSDAIQEHIQAMVKRYLRPPLMHRGVLLPLALEEKEYWLSLQQESDRQDQEILSARLRESAVEEGQFVHTISAQDPENFSFPRAHEFSLSNGIKVFTHKRTDVSKIHCIIQLKADTHHYDPADKQGLYNFMTNLLLEGTAYHSSEQLAELLESHAIEVFVAPGTFSLDVLATEFEYALHIMMEIFTDPLFHKHDIEKVRKQILSELDHREENPSMIADRLIKECLYKGHPLHKNSLGTQASIKRITRKDIVGFYRQMISPDSARIFVVGDFQDDIATTLDNTVGTWKGPRVTDIKYPSLSKYTTQELTHALQRDQVTLCYAGVSVDRKDPDYDKLALFDYIFFYGLGCRLFELREKTGIFYSVSGSTVMGATELPGMVKIETKVSLDRLQEAQELLNEQINVIADSLTQQELDEAKRQMLYNLTHYFSTNAAIARAFLFLNKYQLSQDYFDQRATNLRSITLDQVKEAVKRVLRLDNLITIKVGRI